jgi:hypothetical protein
MYATFGFGLKYDVWVVLPEHPPGITLPALLEAVGCTIGSLRSTISRMRAGNSIREDNKRPRRYWRGPVVAVAKPYRRALELL